MPEPLSFDSLYEIRILYSVPIHTSHIYTGIRHGNALRRKPVEIAARALRASHNPERVGRRITSRASAALRNARPDILRIISLSINVHSSTINAESVMTRSVFSSASL
jgi:hypothetical protein